MPRIVRSKHAASRPGRQSVRRLKTAVDGSEQHWTDRRHFVIPVNLDRDFEAPGPGRVGAWHVRIVALRGMGPTTVV